MDAESLNYQFGNVEVRPRSFEVVKSGTALALEPKSIRVLLHLIENRDRAVSKDELFQVVWGGIAVTDNALSRVIAQLRRALGDSAREPRYIQTIPTLGYRFVGEVRVTGNGSNGAAAPGSRRGRVAAVGMLVVAAAAIMTFALRARTTPEWAEVLHVRSTAQITTSSGFDASPCFSPDGAAIAYSSDRSGRFEIYTRPLRGGLGETQLTSDGAQNLQPMWSPDGSRIAYHSAEKGGIWVVPAQGGEPRRLVEVGSQPAWSPDGTRLAYRNENFTSTALTDMVAAGKSAIYIVPAAGGTPRRITTPGGGVWHAFPSWSPDGKRVVFAAFGGRTSELWTTGVDGPPAKRIAALDSAGLLSPVFTPQGDRILFASYSRAREYGIWQVKLKSGGEAAEGEPVPLTRTGTLLPRDLSISRDGRRLIYSSSSTSSTLWKLPLNAAGDAAGSAEPLYSDVVFRTSFPAYSPDGRHIAFFARLFGRQGNIWVMNADGSGARQFTDSAGMDLVPSWTSDGSAIAFVRSTPQGAQLWRKSLDGPEQVLMNGRQVPGWPRLSPDGKELVYHLFDGRVSNVWSMDLGSGRQQQLTHDAEGAGFPAWSPDGRLIAYELTRGEHAYVAVMDRNGANQAQLHSDPVLNWCFSWSGDSRRIALAGFREGAWNLWWLDRVTREQRKLTNYRSLASYVRYPALSPKGDAVVFEHSITRGNIYAIELE